MLRIDASSAARHVPRDGPSCSRPTRTTVQSSPLLSTFGAGETRSRVGWLMRHLVFGIVLRSEVEDKEAMEAIGLNAVPPRAPVGRHLNFSNLYWPERVRGCATYDLHTLTRPASV